MAGHFTRTDGGGTDVRPFLEHISAKWSLTILAVLCGRPARFNEIMRNLPGVTHKALSEALKRLERGGLVSRRVLPTAPVGVEYALTPLARTMQQPFEAIVRWSSEHSADVERARAAYDRIFDARDRIPQPRPAPTSCVV